MTSFHRRVASRVRGSRVWITVQTEDPRHGNIGTHNEWRSHAEARRPDLREGTCRGRDVQGSRATTVSKHVWADEDLVRGRASSQASILDPMDRVGVNDGKSVYVGQDRRPSMVEDDKPATPRTPTPPPTPTPTKPMGTPPTATPASADAKHWGGNGAP